MRLAGPTDSNLCLFRFPRPGDGMIFSTVPGMVALGRSGIRVGSRLCSAIFADRAMRGFAISFLTLARVALLGSFLALLCMIPRG